VTSDPPSRDTPALIGQFLWYTLFGGLSTLLYWAVFFALHRWIDLDYRIATAVGYGLGSLFNFGLQKAVTFRDRSRRLGTQIGVYTAVQGASLVLSVLMMMAMVEGLGLEELLALVLTTALVLFVNFAGHKFLTFNQALYQRRAAASAEAQGPE